MPFDFCRISLLAVSTLLLAFTSQGQAQERREIETDRDSFTPALTTMEQHRLMVEASYSFIDNRDVKETHSLPELLLRYGLTENLEIRFGTNYEIGGDPHATAGGGGSFPEQPGEAGALEEESKVLYGCKALLTEQAGWVPQTNLLATGDTPTSGPETATRLIVAHPFGWRLSNSWEWATATRFATGKVEEDNFTTWAPSTVLRIPVGERLKAHVEYFGLFSDGQEEACSQHFFSPGIHYLATRDFEIGIRTGWGLNQQSPNFFSNIGFGWQY